MIINGVASEYAMPHSGVSNGAASEYDIIPNNVPNDINDKYLFPTNKITDADKSGRMPMPPITDAPPFNPYLTARHEYERGYDEGFKDGYQKGNLALLKDLADWISDTEIGIKGGMK